MDLDEKDVAAIIKNVALFLCLALPFTGVGLGIIKANEGICKAADYSTDLTLTIVPCVFTTAPAIYCVIFFFMRAKVQTATLEEAMRLLAGILITSISGAITGYSVGSVSYTLVVTRAQQKKFSVTFFLILIFGEIIGIFGFIAGLVVGVPGRK
jgi:V-type H+-transporting ATPase 16kDa proteolipid subunit